MVSKGVETTLNALGPKTAPLLTATTLASLDWPERKAGIQLLTSAEVADLGPLNDAERRTLRRVVNTKDVYPYAVIVEDDPDHVIYLWKPEAIDSKTNMAQAQEWPLPDGIPTLAAYLEQFKPILQDATRSRKERRPWWTLHRPRFDVVGAGSTERWEPFCLTTRWGGGDRLVVGLAPGGTSPASGLHIVRGGSDLQDAAAAARPPPPRCLATRSGHSSVGSRARPGHSLGPTERGQQAQRARYRQVRRCRAAGSIS